MSALAQPLRIAVLLSGGGTSFENLAECCAKGDVGGNVVVCVASKPGAYGLERARRRGIPAIAVDRKQHPEEASFNDALHAVLDRHTPDLIVCAGFLSRFELRRYAGRAMNIHPALIPSFCGKGFYGDRVHRAVLESGVKLTGVSVHFCDDEYDTGPIILQAAVPVEDDDTLETLRARVLQKEHELYPRAVQLFAEGRLEVEGRRTRILPARR